MQVWFFYGTLLDEQVFRAVTRRDLNAFRPQRATALSMARVFLPGQSYPTLIARTGSRTSGLVCQGLPPSVIRRLEAYEGEDYRTRLVPVRLADGRRLAAHTFVAIRSPSLAARRWRPEDWQTKGRALTLKRIAVLGRP
ncbi:MAG: gamma-glutamylcyclotransferase family protein [Rhodospirillales bacterium]